MQERYFLLFLYNSTYILFWPPPNLQEWQKLDRSYFKNSDLISTLLLGLGLSFWDINSTDIGDGQPYGLSPPPYLSATSAPVTRPSPIWFCQRWQHRKPHGILRGRDLRDNFCYSWVLVIYSAAHIPCFRKLRGFLETVSPLGSCYFPRTIPGEITGDHTAYSS